MSARPVVKSDGWMPILSDGQDEKFDFRVFKRNERDCRDAYMQMKGLFSNELRRLEDGNRIRFARVQITEITELEGV